MRSCTKCAVTKALSAFHMRSDRKCGYLSKCKDCCRKSDQERHQKNRAKHLAMYRQYYKNNKEERFSYYLRNKDAIRARKVAAYYKDPSIYIAYAKRRKAKQLNAVPQWIDWDKVKTVYRKAKEWGFAVDHVVPLQSEYVCGLHVWENLQLLHQSLNSKKSNKIWPDMP